MIIRGDRDVVRGTTIACAIAPACVGNIGVGFDLLGHTFYGPADLACVRQQAKGVTLSGVHSQLPGMDGIPLDPTLNTAGRAVQAMVDALDLPFGFEIELHKGISLGSGMGGSAASAVAAVVAANALLDAPLPMVDLYPFARRGESASTDAAPGDNVGPMLLGGLALAPPQVLRALHVPADLYCVVLKPGMSIETRRAREVLVAPYALDVCVTQASHLALLLTGLAHDDFDLIRLGLDDVMIEPRRAHLIPGFAEIKHTAQAMGALGASISGSGPTIFAWFASRATAARALDAMKQTAHEHHAQVETWLSPVAGPAAQLVAPALATQLVNDTLLPMNAFAHCSNRGAPLAADDVTC